MNKLWALLSGLIFLLFTFFTNFSSHSQAATLVVRPDGQGLFPTIQSAINTAAEGDTVLALPGTYSGVGNRDLDSGGKEICLIGRDGSAATVLDCQYQGRGAIFQTGESRTSLIQGFKMIHTAPESNGGGISCDEAGPTIRDIWITGAPQEIFDGGIAVVFGSADISGVVIEDCDIWGAAGGIGLYWADSTQIRDSIIANNEVNGYGGGIVANNSPGVRIESVHFISNHAGISGGGLSCHTSSVSVIGCLFQGNDARDGGAIAVRGTELTLQNCTFIGNYVWRWGGALYYDELGDASWGLVENCDFRGNNSASAGIITLLNHANPIIRDCTLVDNNHGSAIDQGCCFTEPVVENCLIAFNRGGYGIEGSYTNQISISCSDVFGNEYGEYTEYPDQTGINGNISEDPLFCDPTYETLGVADESPCLPEHNNCGVLIGNHGADCTLTAVNAPAPPGVLLEANYPNPFNPSTTIPFSLSEPKAVTLSIHDASGRLLRMLADRQAFPAGSHSLYWNGLDAAGRPAPSGVYFYRLETPSGATARPMLLIK